MNQLLALTFAVAVGLVCGTLPGVREKFPWGRPPTPAPDEIAYTRPVTAIKQPTPSPVPKPGSWMYENRGSLNQRP